MVDLQSHILRAIRDLARAEADREVCGAVLQTAGERQRMLPLQNVSVDPLQFRIDPEQLLHVLLQDRSIVCFFHSHPLGAAIPSETDRQGYSYSYPHVIYSVFEDRFAAFRVTEREWVPESIQKR